MAKDEKELARIAALIKHLATVTAPEGVLVYRTDSEAQPPNVEGWEGPATHVYGGMALHFYQMPA